MIQRVQTLYLSLSFIGCVLLFFFPLAEYANEVQGTYVFYITGVKYLVDPPLIISFWITLPLLVMVAASAIMILISVFLYRKRRIQVMLVSITFLIHVIFISLVLLFYIGHFDKQFQVMHSYKFGIFIPLVSLGFLILANRSIRKDEMLVKSADRLR
jgi:hypothetical protein